jgi:hypothetical protein
VSSTRTCCSAVQCEARPGCGVMVSAKRFQGRKFGACDNVYQVFSPLAVCSPSCTPARHVSSCSEDDIEDIHKVGRHGWSAAGRDGLMSSTNMIINGCTCWSCGADSTGQASQCVTGHALSASRCSTPQEISALAGCRSDHITRYFGSVMQPGSSELLILMELLACSVADLVRVGGVRLRSQRGDTQHQGLQQGNTRRRVCMISWVLTVWRLHFVPPPGGQ